MKLISCYIEGYGKIKKQSYDFADGITVFCKENGEGKTTLASFIKAMFYGLKGYRKGSTEFCDREHFYPFDGGLFGGNITFLLGGKRYKIERFFDDKSETKDTLRAFVNGEITDELGLEPGKTVFGMDKESFERTVFLDSGEVEISSTSGIHARLNAFLEGVDDDGNLDGALEALEKAAKVYKKSRAGADKVSAVTEKIVKLNEEISNATTVKRALEGKYVRFHEIEREIERLSAQIVAAQEGNEKLSQFEHYDSLVERVKKNKADLAALEGKYPLGLPTFAEVETFNSYLVAANALQTRLEGNGLSTADEGKLVALSAQFQNGAPDEEALRSIEDKARRFAALETETKLAENRSFSKGEEELLARFEKVAPSSEKMQKTAEKVEEYKRLKKEYERTPVSYSTTTQTKKKSKKGYAFLAILAVAVAALGGVLLALQNSLGGALLGVGVVGLLADGFLYLNAKSSGQVRVEEENPARKRLENELSEIEDIVKATLLPLGYRSDNGLVYDFSQLQNDLLTYERLRAEKAAREGDLKEKRAAAERLVRELTAFFRAYGLEGDFFKLSADIRVLRKEFADLTARKNLAGAERERLQKECRENQAKIEGFKRQYALRDANVGTLAEDIREVARLRREIEDGEKKADEFKAAKGLGDRVELSKADLGELQFSLQVKQAEKSKLDRQIGDDERLAEKLDGYEADKAAAEEILKEYKQKHRLLTATSAFLTAADGRLKDKYVRPIKEEFLYYAKLIESALGERVSMTKDFELRFERNGAERSEKHLSSGQRSICALCFRLALVKNMYRGQLPFLILDDPFTSLDEGHFQKVSAVLKTLSKEMQMVYFTCHESRKL